MEGGVCVCDGYACAALSCRPVLRLQSGDTALSLGMQYKHADVVELLLDRGADLNVKDNV